MRGFVQTLGRLWQSHRVALIAFMLALVAVSFFAIHFLVSAIYWADPAHRAQSPEGWMTPFYIARSWHLDREVVAKALALDFKQERGLTLAELARARGVPLHDLLAELAAALPAAKAPAPAALPGHD